jgi:hypothetical protein
MIACKMQSVISIRCMCSPLVLPDDHLVTYHCKRVCIDLSIRKKEVVYDANVGDAHPRNTLFNSRFASKLSLVGQVVNK